MLKNHEQWHEDLHRADTPQNHLSTINLLEESFIQSNMANDRKQRIKAMWLLRHVKKLVIL